MREPVYKNCGAEFRTLELSNAIPKNSPCSPVMGGLFHNTVQYRYIYHKTQLLEL